MVTLPARAMVLVGAASAAYFAPFDAAKAAMLFEKMTLCVGQSMFVRVAQSPCLGRMNTQYAPVSGSYGELLPADFHGDLRASGCAST